MELTTDAQRSVSVFFDALAPAYDSMTDIESRLVRERPFFHVLVERYGMRTAIDAGTGTGVHGILLAQLGVHVTAVDVSHDMLHLAEGNAIRHGVTLETVHADLLTLTDVVKGPVDAVLCLGNTLANIVTVGELHRVFAGFRRLLKPGGVLVVQVLNYVKIPRDREVLLLSRERKGVVFERRYRPHSKLLEFETSIRRPSGVETRTVLHHPWSAGTLVSLLADTGFKTPAIHGGIDLRIFDPEVSIDLVLVTQPDVP